MRLRSPPTSSSTRPRIAKARFGSPRACSSITRSSRLVTKVTPLALTACRSTGASKRAERRLPATGKFPEESLAGRRSSSRSWLTVGATDERSRRSSPRTRTGDGPGTLPSTHARPMSSASPASLGRMVIVDTLL